MQTIINLCNVHNEVHSFILTVMEPPNKQQLLPHGGTLDALGTSDHGVVGTIQLAEYKYQIGKLEKQIKEEKEKTERLEERMQDYTRLR